MPASRPLLGCIADDFTGGTDLSGILVKAGMRTVQTVGVPVGGAPADVDAIVVALKSRTTPAAEAVADSLAALHWLQQAGCRQFYFKYCSTFDSTADGNIGPVAEALMQALGCDFTIACPAFPANKRTVYQGYLFVGDVLLSESGMQNHPLTPMRDANLVRVLQAQSKGRVGLVAHAVVGQGAGAIGERLQTLRAEGHALAIADAVGDADLMALGQACADMPLVTGGSGLGLGLAANFSRAGLLTAAPGGNADLPPSGGLQAVVSGSCSQATLRQVARMQEAHPSFQVQPAALARGDDVVAEALAWADDHLPQGPVLVYASATPDAVQASQAALGVRQAGALVEEALSAIAQGLVARGVGRLIVAGGETSGAVVKGMQVSSLRIGPEIDPGVPWTFTEGSKPLALALKSGNFGSDDFFLKAWKLLA